jgi:hypothetical protein
MMKLVDGDETIAVVLAHGLEPGHSDRVSADALVSTINARGAGHPWRRALVVSDLAWMEAPLLHRAPCIAIGGPGVNAVAGQFVPELPTVWRHEDRSLIQAELGDGPRRAALWGMDRAATTEAVRAFIARGWLDEFLDRCWRWRAGVLA